jgi:uncharacterized protein YraI
MTALLHWRTDIVRTWLLVLALCFLAAAAEAATVEVIVADPFLELRTGPGRGYPVTQVVPRGDAVAVLKRRTDWYKVLDARGHSGWVHRDQMAMTLGAAGTQLDFRAPGLDEFGHYRREIGVLAGDFEGGNVITVYGSYVLNPHLAAELRLSQLLGRESDGQIAAIGLSHLFRPDWRVQPFVSIGIGVIRIQPEATQAQEPDSTEQLAYVGAGLKAQLSRRFMFRAEYNKSVVFTDRDDNEEPTEWKLGFAFFF